MRRLGHARRLIFPGLLVVLVALATFGIWQVYVGPGTAQEEQPPEPQSFEELQRLREPSWQRGREEIRAFVDSGGDPCSLPASDAQSVEWATPYDDLASLINDVDLIVIGRPLARAVEAPREETVAGRVLTTIGIEETLVGSSPSDTVVVDLVDRVRPGSEGLGRVRMDDLDPCSSERLLLFLDRSRDEGIFWILYQGWAGVERDLIRAGPSNNLFREYASAEDLFQAVRQTDQRLAAEGAPKGLLRCRAADVPLVCPGDTINPYRDFALQTATAATVHMTDPGPSPLVVAKTELAPGSRQLDGLLRALDVQVLLEADVSNGLPPEDTIDLTVDTALPGGEVASYHLVYSPSTGIIQLPVSVAQFSAPPSFQQQIEALAAQP